MNTRHFLGVLVFSLLGLFTNIASAYSCPDERVTMVVAVGASEEESNPEDAATTKSWGEKAGFVVHHIPVAKHTRTNLLNWMQCKRLSFFYNVSHSISTAIITGANERLTGDDIRKNVNFRGQTIFYSHSCESSIDTGPDSLVRGIKDAKARGFIGTTRIVKCGTPDITTTACVQYAVLLLGYPFQGAVSACSAKYGPNTFLSVNDFYTGKSQTLTLITPSQLPILLEEL